MHVEWPDVLAHCGVRIRPGDLVVVTEAAPLDFPGPRIVHVNEAFTSATGFAPADVVGATPRLLQGARSCRATLDLMRAALAEGRPGQYRLVNYRKDGTPFEVGIDLQPLPGAEGTVMHWVAVQQDITPQVLGESIMRAGAPTESMLLDVGAELLLHTGAACGVAAWRASASRPWHRRPLLRPHGGVAVEGDRALVDAALAMLALRLSAHACASIATTGAEMAKRGAAARCRDGSELAVVLMQPRGQAWPVADQLLAPVVQRMAWALDARGAGAAADTDLATLR